MSRPEDLDPEERGLFEVFDTLRVHIVQIMSDLTVRVRQGIEAEDDGRFGPPSLAEILGDLTGNAGRVFTEVTGLTSADDQEGPDGES